MPFVSRLPENARPSTVMEPYPKQREYMLRLTEEVMRAPASLTSAQRELIASYVSALNACRFCYGAHARTAEGLGVAPGLVASLLDDLETADVEAVVKPLLRYARTLTLAPAQLTQADADAIFAAGWDEDAFHHVVAVTALFNFYNRLIEGYGVKAEPDFRELVGDRLVAGGYLSGLEASVAADREEQA